MISNTVLKQLVVNCKGSEYAVSSTNVTEPIKMLFWGGDSEWDKGTVYWIGVHIFHWKVQLLGFFHPLKSIRINALIL